MISVHNGGAPVLSAVLHEHARFVGEALQAEKEAVIHSAISEARAQTGPRKEAAALTVLAGYDQTHPELRAEQAAFLDHAALALSSKAAFTSIGDELQRLDGLVEVGLQRFEDDLAAVPPAIGSRLSTS